MELSVLCERLRRQAQAIDALVAGLDEDVARFRAEPEGWSTVEVVNHLADEEVEDFRRRLALTLHDPKQSWPAIAPETWPKARRYQERDLRESLARFLGERQTSIAWLGGLAEPDWHQAHEHPRAGPVRAGDLAAAWLAHDLLHVRQLTRLQYRALRTLAPGFDVGYAGRW